MAASLAWRDTDNSTVITTWTSNALIPQGQKYSVVAGSWKKLFVYNNGTVDFSSVSVDIGAIGGDDGYNDAAIAPDNTGSPDTANKKKSGEGGVQLGAINQGSSSPIWLDIEVDSSRAVGTHQFQLLAAGTV